MCMRLFLGSDARLPSVGWDATGGELQAHEPRDVKGLDIKLRSAHVIELSTGEGCACDFEVANEETWVATVPDRPDAREDLDRALSRARRLHEYVSAALSRGTVVAWSCWFGEAALPPCGVRDVELAWFLRPALDDVQRVLLRVRA